MKRILIIEDDLSIAEIERDFLEINGFEGHIVTDGNDGLKEALSGQYDLILLDLMLPNIDGYEICKRIRHEIDIPILMVTARTEDVDAIRGLGLGADDYISKPFSPTQLVARVKANLSQYERLKGTAEKEDEAAISISNIRLLPGSRRVYVGGEEVEFKNREYELLYFLMSNPEIVFSRDTLYERIWGLDAVGDTKTVAVHINRLRDKIEQDPANPTHIETVWGAGYRFRI
ncbi:response regulator transcription factor [Christensenellaceae bacterium OttesenSCG-928-M15]|nr:response regulator transcription factor [Christensenellaceae bacterium OttesenSCG-928-M15]